MFQGKPKRTSEIIKQSYASPKVAHPDSKDLFTLIFGPVSITEEGETKTIGVWEFDCHTPWDQLGRLSDLGAISEFSTPFLVGFAAPFWGFITAYTHRPEGYVVFTQKDVVADVNDWYNVSGTDEVVDLFRKGREFAKREVDAALTRVFLHYSAMTFGANRLGLQIKVAVHSVDGWPNLYQ